VTPHICYINNVTGKLGFILPYNKIKLTKCQSHSDIVEKGGREGVATFQKKSEMRKINRLRVILEEFYK
jgi:hypothetical protein